MATTVGTLRQRENLHMMRKALARETPRAPEPEPKPCPPPNVEALETRAPKAEEARLKLAKERGSERWWKALEWVSRRAQMSTFDVQVTEEGTESDPIVMDIVAVERLVTLGEWKATALLGGSVLEALLLSAIAGVREAVSRFRYQQLALSKGKRDDGARWDQRPEDWGLYGLIRAAEAVAILSPDEVDLCHRARLVRNRGHHGLGSEAIGRPDALDVRAAVCALLAKARMS